jgi:hypothetical protein
LSAGIYFIPPNNTYLDGHGDIQTMRIVLDVLQSLYASHATCQLYHYQKMERMEWIIVLSLSRSRSAVVVDNDANKGAETVVRRMAGIIEIKVVICLILI